jgi:hypothetical protein
MKEERYKGDEAFLSGSRNKGNESDIGDFFYDIKPSRDAGIGLTEKTIDYSRGKVPVAANGKATWILFRGFRVSRLYTPRIKIVQAGNTCGNTGLLN